jgi:hypothetical protein
MKPSHINKTQDVVVYHGNSQRPNLSLFIVKVLAGEYPLLYPGYILLFILARAKEA